MRRAGLALFRRRPAAAALGTGIPGFTLRNYSASLPEVAAAGPAGWTAAAAGGGGSLADRYSALVAQGTLRPDPHQAACMQRLDRLARELQQHSVQVAAYHQDYAAYQQRRQVLLNCLMDQEEQRLAAEEEGAAASATSRLGSMRSWLSAALGAPDEQQDAPRRSAHQRRTLARASAERRLDQQMGPPPAPPAAPKGVYLHGSVGSGKSLLMDLLSTSVHSAGSVPHHRRLHFNAAMLELHSRMHAIESDRMAQDRQQMDAYAAALRELQQQQAAGDTADGSSSSSKDSSGGSSSSSWQQILRLDPVTQQLRRSKLARLAYRRIMREKAGRSDEEHSAALSAANAAILRHAARALIRNCDTLQLMGGSGSRSSDEAHHGGGSGGARIAALLCFDEIQVGDPFTAVALKGLIEALTAEGCVVVATSNRAPWELDRHGLHENLFSHFIQQLESACDVVPLSAEQDYRRLLSAQHPLQPLPAEPSGSSSSSSKQQLPPPPLPQASYFYPLGSGATAALQQQWQQLTGSSSSSCGTTTPAVATAGTSSAASSAPPADLAVMFGRNLRVERAAGGFAWFHFAELCARPLGAADYMAVSQAYHTVFLEGVPAMSMQVRDQARRFITLVDELYNHRCRIVCTAAAAPDQLFAGADHEEPIIDLESLQFEGAVEGSRLRRNLMADGGVAPVAATSADAAAAVQRLGGSEERFAFARAVSRLYEMQTELYLASRPRD